MKSLMKGNEAIAEAALRAGCKFFFGYPITPQTELAAYMSKRMPKLGYTFLQAESEVAAINMVYGASAAGARVMTSSSSPGVSLKMEGISYIAAADLPCVVVNIVRAGPGLGGILPAQNDYFQATKGGGHGDYHMVVLAPSSIQEVVDLTTIAFDLGDKYRTPVMLLGDGMLGQMMEPVEFPEDQQSSEIQKPWAVTGTKMQRKSNVVNTLNVDPEGLEKAIFERQEKYNQIIENEVRVETYMAEDADIIFAAYGVIARVAKTVVGELRKMGYKAGLIRPITVWPFPYEAFSQAAKTAKIFVAVEMSMGQMVEDVKLGVNGQKSVYFYGRVGGMVPEPADIISYMMDIMGGGESR